MTPQRATQRSLYREPTRSVRWLILAALAASLALGACRGQAAAAADVQVSLSLSPTPPAVGATTVSVGLAQANGSPIDGAVVEVEGDMTHAGMAPVSAQAVPTGDGRYATRDFQFTMSGDWVLTVRATLPDGRRIERAFPVTGVQAGQGALRPVDSPGPGES
jgi:hypothetical protein